MIQKLIIDCDCGIDDALAVLFILASDRVKCKAITTVSGNVDVFQATDNILKVLEIACPKEMPIVARGERFSLSGKVQEARDVHGKDGLGNTFLPPSKTKIKNLNASALIFDLLTKEKNIDLVAIGPLTNIAKVIELNGDNIVAIEEIIVMGGFQPSSKDTDRTFEFNISCDPQAAKQVIMSPFNKLLVDLSITSEVILKKKHIEYFKKYESRFARFIVEILNHSLNHNRAFRKLDGVFIHDVVACAIAEDRSLAKFEEVCIDVDIFVNKGRINKVKGRSNIKLCTWFDSGKFVDLFIEKIDSLINRHTISVN